MKEKTYINLFIFMSILPTGIFLFFFSLYISVYVLGPIVWRRGFLGDFCMGRVSLFSFFFPSTQGDRRAGGSLL